MSIDDLFIRLLMAVVAGAVLGWEREWKQKPAGLKTHMLVTLGSAAFVLAALQFFAELEKTGTQSAADMMKVVGGIVGGVGFLGAGSIMRTGGNVQGLTTAATIWLAAAIGVAVGFGYLMLAGMCVLFALLTLIAFELVERVFFPQSGNNHPQGKSPAKATPAQNEGHNEGAKEQA